MAFLGGRAVLLSVRRCQPFKTQSRHFSPFAWYNKQLERAPVITKSITSGSKWEGLVFLLVHAAPMQIIIRLWGTL